MMKMIALQQKCVKLAQLFICLCLTLNICHILIICSKFRLFGGI